MKDLLVRLQRAVDAPVSVLRLEIIRITAPLFVLGFMSPRLAHADEWIGETGFRVPALMHDDPRQSLYVPGLPHVAVLALAIAMVVSAVATSIGYKTRQSALVYAATLTFVGLSDHLAAFSVSRISPVIMVAIALGPSGQRVGLDAWLSQRKTGLAPARTRPLGSLRFFQMFVPVFYCASGIAKARGEWLTNKVLLYSHMHDSYQTPVSYLLASHVPAWGFTAMQALVLTFELFAPLWFALRHTRPVAFVISCGMHVMIALLFGPVVWFGLLMLGLVAGAFMPEWLLGPIERVALWFERWASIENTTVPAVARPLSARRASSTWGRAWPP
jgi:uncharacterized membrane protein YphA (DoxX/SURF4 family)